MTRSCIVALLGAESTGKTTLAADLCSALASRGHDTVVVPEYLREFCDREGRTPRRDEQAAIAGEQTRRIRQAAAERAIVIADTTALMIAVYSELVFGDRSLYDETIAAHACCDVTLLTALDLPWLADGLQRDGPHVREPVDGLVRAALVRGGLPFSIVSGQGSRRVQTALASVLRTLAPPAEDALQEDRRVRWYWACERCGDPDCERHAPPATARRHGTTP